MDNDNLKLDYTLKTMEERNDLVQQIIASAPSSQLTPKYLEILADYILNAMPKEDKKSRKYLTDNRMITIKKRETSYEDLVSKFENGEDGVYNLMTDDKNIILTPKIEITAADILEIPELAKLQETIASLESQAKAATGKRKYMLKKAAIEMRQDQYVLKNLFRQPIHPQSTGNLGGNRIELKGDITFDKDGEPVSTELVTLFNPDHVSAILCNYELLNTSLKYKFSSDFHYLMEDFNSLLKQVLVNYPVYSDLVRLKIEGKTNNDIQVYLAEKHGIKHSIEYLSSLWRNKIPKLLAEQAKENYIIWYYTEIERGIWKKCSRCGQVKLAHNRFFSKNKTSKDGWYSICKCCRNNRLIPKGE